MDIYFGNFVWSRVKEFINIQKHGVDFYTAARAFSDPKLRIFIDSRHSQDEERFFCFGKVGERVLTIRFVYRGGRIRIFGAGYWRMGEYFYEKEKEI